MLLRLQLIIQKTIILLEPLKTLSQAAVTRT